MSVNPVDVQKLASTYTTYEAAKKALQSKEIDTATFVALIEFQKANNGQATGLEVEQANDGEMARSEEERQKNVGAKAQADEITEMKNAAMGNAKGENVKTQFTAIDAELKAAGHDPEKLRAAADKLEAFLKANPDFKPEPEQPKDPNEPAKFSKVRTINTKYYDIDIYENGRAIYSPHVPTEQQEVKSKKEYRQQAKASS